MDGRPSRMSEPLHQLSPAAIECDRRLAELDGQVDWLAYVTPVNYDALRDGFVASGYRELPPLEYAPVPPQSLALRESLLELPIRQVEEPDIQALLNEKQREIDKQLELIRLRGTSGFPLAGIDMFGRVDDRLLDIAETIVDSVSVGEHLERDVDAEEFAATARQTMADYRAARRDLEHRVFIHDRRGTHIYTSSGDLYVAPDYRVNRARVRPLIEHEIGTHTLTHYNGRQQPLSIMSRGLAGYDGLQEGLAVLAEYLAGYLPPGRLRQLAARVIAADGAVREASDRELFDRLHVECGLDREDALETLVRARRGGGVTKDALYLEGLVDVLDYLRGGGLFESLFVGKFAFKHLETLTRLVERRFLRPPALLPLYLDEPVVRSRLDIARHRTVVELCQGSPAS